MPDLRRGPAGLLAAAVLVLSQPAPPRAATPAVLVSAAASLTDAVTAIAAGYRQATGTAVELNVGPSSGLARQIVNGAPVDVFLSADEAQMDVVAHAGLVASGSRVDLLSNQLVVIAPADRARPLASIRDLAGASYRRIAAANPAAVPAGVYAREYLEAQHLWTAIQPKIVPTLDVRAALAAVDGGNVDAGFVYRTDAALARRSSIVFSVPVDEGPRITYPAAVMTRAPNPDGARRFLAYLRGPAARAVFARFGFLVPSNFQLPTSNF
jgi:molybdate transport system substrate-binding protein